MMATSELFALLLLVSSVVGIIAKPADATFNREDGRLFWQPSKHQKQENTCGYQSCNAGKSGMLNVHLVPHTHDDVGWLKTVDQYYYGSKMDIQRAGVGYILDTVIPVLQNDPTKKFIYVEIAFFYRWWTHQTDAMRHIVRGLVSNGQLQFTLGGWCMNDEASTHYNAIIDQHTLGFRFLEDNFGDCGRPLVGWQIDPFGHSREQASIFAQFGFDGLFFGRLDYQDKDKRLKDKTMELMWKGSANLGDQGMLLTGVNYNGYGPPPGFCYDILCSDEPIMDDPRLQDYNKDERVDAFLKYVNEQAKNYSTNHIMLTMGSDFQFVDAHVNFKNMDKLIQYVNERQTDGSRVYAFYSTPSCYLYSLNQANQSYTSKDDDFFPYAHRPHSFWTGYFTSRAALKGYARQTNNFLQVVKQLDGMTQLEATHGSDLKIRALAQALGVAQHHDAVSGTEKQAVAYDYAQRLAKGIALCEDVISAAFDEILPLVNVSVPAQNYCPLTNITLCDFTENNDKMTLIVYNPVGRSTTTWVTVPVAESAFKVTDSSAKAVSSQFVPLSNQTKAIPERNGSRAIGEVVFEASVPALGLATYFITKTSDQSATAQPSIIQPHSPGNRLTLKNEYLNIDFDPDTGLLKGITNLEKSISASISQNFLFYESMPGNNSEGQFQASGAYVFRPMNQTATVISSKTTVTNVQGDLVQEVHQVFSNWTSQVVRLHARAKYVEFEWTVGPIPIQDKKGREVISRFTTDLQTKSTFYTDSNGREMLKRVRDYRPTWELNQTEPVAGNYYPINSRIYIQDESKKSQLTVLTDRSQGGGSIQDGEVEIMVHRRTLYDDALGVGEPLNETGSDGKGLIIRGTHYVFLDTIDSSAKLHRDLAERLYMAPSLSYSALKISQSDYVKQFLTTWSGLYQQELPANVHLLTLEGWRANTALIRFEHMYEKGEDSYLSKPVNVTLKGMFNLFDISAVEELTLGANQKLTDAKRLVWNVNDYGPTKSDMSSYVRPFDPATFTIELQPMQIRTFQVTIGNSKSRRRAA